MLANKIEAIGRAPLTALDAVARAVWQDFGTGKITEAETNAIVEAIENRRRAARKPAGGLSVPRVSVVWEGTERAPQRNVEAETCRSSAAFRGPRQLQLVIPRPTTYDRARSRERRRRLAYSGPMPAHLAQSFTPAEVAVLRIVADEHRDRGACARSVGEIAARAGVCVRTVQNALRHAERLGLVTITDRRRPGARSLTNIVRVVSREWLAWIEHHSKARERQAIGCKTVHPTDKLLIRLWCS
jgi:DNA-binding CsgD family transcriptional regulator